MKVLKGSFESVSVVATADEIRKDVHDSFWAGWFTFLVLQSYLSFLLIKN